MNRSNQPSRCTFQTGEMTMKTAIRTVVTAAAIAGLSNVAYAQASETVDVTATLTKRTQLAVFVEPPSFGEIAVPGDENATCSYVLQADTGGGSLSFVTGASVDDPNPDTELCRFSGTEIPNRIQVTCEGSTDYTFDITTITSAPAAALGLSLTGSAPGLLDDSFSGKAASSETCPSFGLDELRPRLKLSVPGTAEAFDGTVGTMAISVNY